MATYALLTRLTPEALESPTDMLRLEQAVAEWERFKLVVTTAA